VELRKIPDVIGRDILYAAFVDDARRDQTGGDKLPQPRRSERIVFVVIR
jgi:hypothetical protein